MYVPSVNVHDAITCIAKEMAVAISLCTVNTKKYDVIKFVNRLLKYREEEKKYVSLEPVLISNRKELIIFKIIGFPATYLTGLFLTVRNTIICMYRPTMIV